MKKNYTKPCVYLESLALSKIVTGNCNSAPSYWVPTPMPDYDNGTTVMVFVELAGCSYDENTYISTYGPPNQGRCYVASTDDGKTFS